MRMVRAARAGIRNDTRAVARVPSQLGYGIESVRNWVKQADIDEGERPGTTSDERRTDQGAREGEPRAQALQ